MPVDRPRLRIEVCRASPASAARRVLEVAEGSTVGDALAQGGFGPPDGVFDRSVPSCAIFGRRVSLETRLHEGDRIELLRLLIVDPKEARRRRALKKNGTATPPRVGPEPS